MVRLLLLTGQRREEVGGMAWAEVSADLATWTVPAERTKNGVPSVVPLSAPAQDMLAGAAGGGAGAAPRAGVPWRGRQGDVWRLVQEQGQAGQGRKGDGWRLHDLRRTVATGLQRLGVRLEVTEAVLNHVSGTRGGIVGIYQRHDWAAEKRTALDGWAAHFMAALVGADAGPKVVPMRRGRRAV